MTEAALHAGTALPASGTARVDRRTKLLLHRLTEGDVAVIDHRDIDRVAAQALVAARPAAVINAAPSISGRYPNVGPLLIVSAGIPLVDEAGPGLFVAVAEGDHLALRGGEIFREGLRVAGGTLLTKAAVEERLKAARSRVAAEIDEFAENTIEYLRHEKRLLIDELELPEVPVELAGRQVLVVSRGVDHLDDLRLLRRSGYLKEMRPVLIGVDGGADALLAIGTRPDLIIGDFDSVSDRALHSGAALVVHAYRDGGAPGAERLDHAGLPYQLLVAPGTSEDVALLLAHDKGAALIVAVGSHTSMMDFLDKGRPGMASTFLVRMKVGPVLVDAKGVNRLYQNRVRKLDLAMMVLAALVTLVTITIVSEPIRLFLRGFWLSVR
jgi:uncharacterized membrane-anchored protein